MADDTTPVRIMGRLPGNGHCIGWYLMRDQQYAAWRVAMYASLGAGFGFAFANFLQVLGTVSGITFNFWNLMEYAIELVQSLIYLLELFLYGILEFIFY